MKLVRVCLLAQNRGAVVIGKRVLNDLCVVLEIEDEDIVLLRMGAVQTGERLHGFDAAESLIHIHGVQERFVVAGLKLVGADEEAIRVFLDAIRDVATRKWFQLRLADFLALVFRFP